MAERRNFSADVRLACQTTVTGDVVLRRLVLDEDDRALIDAEVIGAAPRSVGEERLLAILFSDIRNFTAFSEAHLPYDCHPRPQPVLQPGGRDYQRPSWAD
jgi:adenylate cyclase